MRCAIFFLRRSNLSTSGQYIHQQQHGKFTFHYVIELLYTGELETR